jgi:hypothetical protein
VPHVLVKISEPSIALKSACNSRYNLPEIETRPDLKKKKNLNDPIRTG